MFCFPDNDLQALTALATKKQKTKNGQCIYRKQREQMHSINSTTFQNKFFSRLFKKRFVPLFLSNNFLSPLV